MGASDYPRFGFRPGGELGIAPPNPTPGEAWMVLPLTDAERDWRGRVVYPAAFDVVARS